MGLGAITHLALRVSDRPRSEWFYDRVLGLLGYQRITRTDDFTMWWSPTAGAITLSDSPANGANGLPQAVRPAPYAPMATAGLHHLAFSADSKTQVDALYHCLQTLGATILKAPYDGSTADYYAVLFQDPDGIQLELVHMEPPP